MQFIIRCYCRLNILRENYVSRNENKAFLFCLRFIQVHFVIHVLVENSGVNPYLSYEGNEGS